MEDIDGCEMSADCQFEKYDKAHVMSKVKGKSKEKKKSKKIRVKNEG